MAPDTERRHGGAGWQSNDLVRSYSSSLGGSGAAAREPGSEAAAIRRQSAAHEVDESPLPVLWRATAWAGAKGSAEGWRRALRHQGKA